MCVSIVALTSHRSRDITSFAEIFEQPKPEILVHMLSAICHRAEV